MLWKQHAAVWGHTLSALTGVGLLGSLASHSSRTCSSQQGLRLPRCCRKQENCTAWFYCQDFHGCIDEQGTKLPENGCQLKWEPRQPWGIPQEGQLLARPSTYASGYVKRAFCCCSCSAPGSLLTCSARTVLVLQQA